MAPPPKASRLRKIMLMILGVAVLVLIPGSSLLLIPALVHYLRNRKRKP